MNKALRHAHTGRQGARSPGHGVCTHCGVGGSPRGGAEAGSGTSERRTAAGLLADSPALVCCP